MSSTGSFLSATYNSLCSQLAASACCSSCSNQGPYHRHCGCSLHAAYWKFDGGSSPKCQVKITNKKARSGMFRSLSVQNLGDKSLSASCSSGSCSSETQSPFYESSFEARKELTDEECTTFDRGNNHTVLLMEELATLIQEMKEGEMDSEEMCCNVDDGSPAPEQKQFLAYRSGMFRSQPNLCAYAELDSKGFPETAPDETDLPRFLPQV